MFVGNLQWELSVCRECAVGNMCVMCVEFAVGNMFMWGICSVKCL